MDAQQIQLTLQFTLPPGTVPPPQPASLPQNPYFFAASNAAACSAFPLLALSASSASALKNPISTSPETDSSFPGPELLVSSRLVTAGARAGEVPAVVPGLLCPADAADPVRLADPAGDADDAGGVGGVGAPAASPLRPSIFFGMSFSARKGTRELPMHRQLFCRSMLAWCLRSMSSPRSMSYSPPTASITVKETSKTSVPSVSKARWMRPWILAVPTPCAMPSKRESSSRKMLQRSAHSLEIIVACAPLRRERREEEFGAPGWSVTRQ